MNCRFCGNFVPEGRDSCPVCGRRPEEEPIGKLLSDNQPGALQKAEEEEAAAKAAAAKAAENKKHPKGLLLPLIMIAASVLGWMYALLGDSYEKFKTMLAVVTGKSTSVSPDSSVTVGGGANDGELVGVVIYAAAALVITLVGVVGVIWLFKRLYNRIKYRD